MSNIADMDASADNVVGYYGTGEAPANAILQYYITLLSVTALQSWWGKTMGLRLVLLAGSVSYKDALTAVFIEVSPVQSGGSSATACH